MRRERRELVVVGAGPAGLAAVLEARRAGLDTCVFEARARPGGRLASGLDGAWPSGGRRLIAEALASGAELCTGSVAWDIREREVSVSSEARPRRLLVGDQVILATGAYARPVVFPGWTLPGVMTAAGALRLVRQGVSPGRRVLVAGCGAWVASAAAELQRHNVTLVGIVDACAADADAAPGLAAARGGTRVPIRRRQMVVRVDGEREVQRAVIAQVDADWRPRGADAHALEIDTLVLAFGGVPENVLSRLAGCEHTYAEELGGQVTLRDAWMRTSVRGILVAGDAGGVLGPTMSIAQGRLAGIAAAVDAGRLAPGEAERRAVPIWRRLAAAERGRARATIGAGVYELAQPDTVVCRCEDVTAAQIAAALFEGTSDLGTLVGETRAGMGSCQGRNCARQIAAIVAAGSGRLLQDISPMTARPPAMLVPMGAVAQRPRATEPLTDVSAALPRPG